MKTLLIVLLCIGSLVAADELTTLTTKDGRVIGNARVVAVGSFGVKYSRAIDGTRVLTLPPTEMSAETLALFKARMDAATVAEQQRAREAQERAEASRTAAMKGTLTAQTTDGKGVMGVTKWEIEPSGLVVKFTTVYGEKRVAIKDLTAEWQTKIKQPK